MLLFIVKFLYLWLLSIFKEERKYGHSLLLLTEFIELNVLVSIHTPPIESSLFRSSSPLCITLFILLRDSLLKLVVEDPAY